METRDTDLMDILVTTGSSVFLDPGLRRGDIDIVDE
jgi:hypothetical protein